MKKTSVVKIIILVVIGLIIREIIFGGILILIFSSGFNDEYEITTDISQYQTVIGDGKWEMNEEIFPKDISNLTVSDFKYVYYNPWDANYLAYLVVGYQDEEKYKEELSRLENLGITDYLGYYSVTGFTKYNLVAMNADSYNGFIYAITDNESKIIYVELVFCNYYMDIKYEEQIPLEYLPDGFDATSNNSYMKSKTKSSLF